MSDKTEKPLVSVVLTNYNHGKYIAETIDSVLSQSFQNYELLILDNCSTDNSVEVIRTFKDDRVKFIQNDHNLGMVMNINKGVELAEGRFIAHICADDIWHSKKLEKQVNEFENQPDLGAVFTGVTVLDEAGKETPNAPYQKIFDKAENKSRIEWLKSFFNDGNVLCFPSALVKREILVKHRLYDSKYQIALDLDMWIKICSEKEIFYVGDRLVKFRAGENSTSSQNISGDIFSQESIYYLKNYLKLSDEDFRQIFDVENNDFDKEKTLIEKCMEIGGDKFLLASQLFFTLENTDAEFRNWFFKKRAETLEKHKFIRIGKTYKNVQKIKNIEKLFRKLFRGSN